MKLSLVTIASICFSFNVSASTIEQGSYTRCVSDSPHAQLTIGKLNATGDAETVELSIDEMSLGEAEIDNEVLMSIDEDSSGYRTYDFTEADHEALNWLTVKLSPVDAEGKNTATLLSGIDPRVPGYPAKMIETPIFMRCEAVTQ